MSDLPPDVEHVEVALGNNRYRISVGLRNTIPHPTIGYASVAPMLNASTDIVAHDNDDIMEQVKQLYQTILPPYMFLVTQQMALMTRMGKEGATKVGLEIMGVYHGEQGKL